MNSYYRRRLETDLKRWVDAGFVGPDGARAILSDVTRERSGDTNRIVAILSILGAILVGAGAISFVAANWQEFPRLMRLGLLIASIFSAYGAAAALFQRGLGMFAHGAVLVGSSLFGASVMLVAQMYHIHGNPPDAVFVWAAGALLAGTLMRSNPTIVMSLLLVGLWGGWETQQVHGVFWPFLPAWIAVTGVLLAKGCRYGVKLAAVLLAIWIIWLGGYYRHEITVVVGAAFALAGLLLSHLWSRHENYGRLLTSTGFALAMVGLFALHLLKDWHGVSNLPILAAYGVSTLALAIVAAGWGIRTNDRTLTWLAYAGFTVEVGGLYLKTIGTLMNTSLFFLSVGAGVILLAAAAYWINRHLRMRKGAAQ